MARTFVIAILVALLGAAFVAADFGASVKGPPPALAAQKKRPGLLQRLFGPRKQVMEKTPRSSAPRKSAPGSKRRDRRYSGYRTLCVRTCDGYYFPISFSASRSRFKTDETVCKAMYGGFDAKLFVVGNRSSADKAVSLKGKPLASESYAFAYRHNFVEKCQAELKTGLARLGAAFSAKAAAAQATVSKREGEGEPRLLPNPLPRPGSGSDPETLANRAGSFKVRPVTPSREADIAGARRIRKLGPDYYYTRPIVIQSLRDPLPVGPEFSLISSAEASPGPRMLAPGKPIDRQVHAPINRGLPESTGPAADREGS